jgi:hypothetical protein
MVAQADGIAIDRSDDRTHREDVNDRDRVDERGEAVVVRRASLFSCICLKSPPAQNPPAR